jgi:N-acetylmuramoyl-L-alanine amidase
MHEPSIIAQPLPYASQLPTRAVAGVDLVVLHCTELPDLAMAREYGERAHYPSGIGHSGHFYIDRDGSIHRYVDPLRTANHTRGYNPRSIGIELVNTGRYPDWYDSRRQVMTEPYPSAQIAALVDLLRSLRDAFPALVFVAGHEDLDVATIAASDDPSQEVPRKRDPGPRFPWADVLARTGLERLPERSPL